MTFLEGSYSPYGASYDFTATDAISGGGHVLRANPENGSSSPTAVWSPGSADNTIRGAWAKSQATLDSGGTLADLHVEGNTVVWTHDGVRRTHSQHPDGQ